MNAKTATLVAFLSLGFAAALHPAAATTVDVSTDVACATAQDTLGQVGVVSPVLARACRAQSGLLPYHASATVRDRDTHVSAGGGQTCLCNCPSFDTGVELQAAGQDVGARARQGGCQLDAGAGSAPQDGDGVSLRHWASCQGPPCPRLPFEPNPGF